MIDGHDTRPLVTERTLPSPLLGQRIIGAELQASNNVSRSEKSRTQKPDLYPERFPVSADKANWNVEYTDYNPQYFVAQVVLDFDETKRRGGWAEPEDISLVDHEITSYEGEIAFNELGHPVNPYTRTGIRGRGLLGKHGPNFAADPIVSRIDPETGDFEIAAVVRGDTGEDAIPGGMVDKGEAVSVTLGREFKEETGGELDMSNAQLVYRGYVDDPRNTDNAWMETNAMHRHLSLEEAAAVTFSGPEDSNEIKGIKWLPINKDSLGNLYASHGELVTKAIELMLADQGAPISLDVRQCLELAIAA